MEPFFFQLLDRVRFQAALNALGSECKSLALISPVQVLAEHYKDAVLEKLQDYWPGLEIKTFFPADSDSIVQAFNQVVAEMSVTQALDRKLGQSGLKLWIVQNASALPAHELLLLLQLLEKFPGAKVRALLMYAGAEMLPDGLDGFEKSLMKWVIERPKLVQIKEAMAQEQDPDRLVELRELIQQMAPGHVSQLTSTATHDSNSPPPKQSLRTASSKKSFLKSWVAVTGMALLILVISLGVTVQLYPESLRQPLVKWISNLIDPSETEESKPDVDGNEDTPLSTESSGSSVPLQPKQNPAEISRPESSPSHVSETAVGLTATVQAEPVTEWPDEAAKGETWAWQLTVSQFIIQHSIDPNYDQILQIKSKYSDLKEFHVVPQFLGTQDRAHFAWVSGPFATRAEAEYFLKTHALPKDGWIRKAVSLQERLMFKKTAAPKP